MRIKELREMAHEGVKETARHFTTPNADWAPVALVDDGRDINNPYAIDLRHVIGHDELWQAVIPSILQHVDAHGAVFIISMWAAPTVGDDDVPIPERANRFEILTITTVSQLGAETEVAKILRSPNLPPRLDAWVKMEPLNNFAPLVDWLRRIHADR